MSRPARTIRRSRTTLFTSLNGGMSLQALMALLGHVSAEMTLRYASLASPTVRAAYDHAMSKARSRLTLPIAPIGHPVVPDRVQWLRAEMLKTRVAHGYCSRNPVAEACSYGGSPGWAASVSNRITETAGRPGRCW